MELKAYIEQVKPDIILLDNQYPAIRIVNESGSPDSVEEARDIIRLIIKQIEDYTPKILIISGGVTEVRVTLSDIVAMFPKTSNSEIKEAIKRIVRETNLEEDPAYTIEAQYDSLIENLEIIKDFDKDSIPRQELIEATKKQGTYNNTELLIKIMRNNDGIIDKNDFKKILKIGNIVNQTFFGPLLTNDEKVSLTEAIAIKHLSNIADLDHDFIVKIRTGLAQVRLESETNWIIVILRGLKKKYATASLEITSTDHAFITELENLLEMKGQVLAELHIQKKKAKEAKSEKPKEDSVIAKKARLLHQRIISRDETPLTPPEQRAYRAIEADHPDAVLSSI